MILWNFKKIMSKNNFLVFKTFLERFGLLSPQTTASVHSVGRFWEKSMLSDHFIVWRFKTRMEIEKSRRFKRQTEQSKNVFWRH